MKREGIKMYLNKNKRCTEEAPTVNFNIKISLRTAFIDGEIDRIIKKIKSNTKDIPHVNIKFYIS